MRTCNELKVMIDLSHLNEKGFWNVAKISDAPLVATHSNAHTLCASPRNLTDKQLDAIKETDGMVGINFHVGFLREDGRYQEPTSSAKLSATSSISPTVSASTTSALAPTSTAPPCPTTW